MNTKKLIYILLGVALVLTILIVIGKDQGWISSGSEIRVSANKVSFRTIVETVDASGKIYPEVEVKITPDVSGEIVELFIEEGDSVKQGALMARIRPDIYASIVERAAAALNNSRAGMANSKARLVQTKARLKNEETSFSRSEKLHKEGVISDADFETAKLSWATAEAEYEASDQTVKGAEFMIKSSAAALKEAKDNLDKTNIYAPMDGIVSKLSIEKGERVVGTAQMAGTEMMRVANMSSMEVQVDVSENDILKVSVGDTCNVEVDAYLNRKFQGIVSEISNSANSDMGGDQVTNFTVKILLLASSYEDLVDKDNLRNFPFRPGMSALVEIMTERSSKYASVPIQSVTTRLEDSTDKDDISEIEEVVFKIVDSTGLKTAQKVTVKTGIQDDSYIQILEGLTEDEEVVSGPYRAISKNLKDGDLLNVVDKDQLFEKDE